MECLGVDEVSSIGAVSDELCDDHGGGVLARCLHPEDDSEVFIVFIFGGKLISNRHLRRLWC